MKKRTKKLIQIGGLLALLMLALTAAGTLPVGFSAGHAAPDRYIVQANSPEAAREAVATVGGHIIDELALIDALVVLMTPAQSEHLVAHHSGIMVTPDMPVAVASGSEESVRDEFNSQNYNLNEGSADWNSSWLETNDNGTPSGGNIWITSGGLLLLRRPDRAIRRAVYLPTGSAATLNFSYKLRNFDDPSQYVALEISTDGGANWSELTRYEGPAHDPDLIPVSYDISAYAAPDTVIRFATSAAMNAQTKFTMDYIEVVYSNDTVSTEVIETLYDTFSNVAYNNNDGSVNWTTDWLESGDDGTAAGGNLRVRDDKGLLQITQTNRQLQRSADLSDALTAELRFDSRRIALDSANDYVQLEISADGGANWTEIDRFEGPDNDTAFQTNVYDITAYAAADVVIRFTSAPTHMNNYDKVQIDDLKISYVVSPDTFYPELVGADELHAAGIDGKGITVAVLDTGYWSHDYLDNDLAGQARVLAQYNALTDSEEPVGTASDDSGHGVHVTSMIMSSNVSSNGVANGIAPNANLVSVKAFAADGSGSYSDVIRGIEWVLENQATYAIRVLNLSFSATPQSYYWDDPLNQAVMRAWQAGIVVVAASGNTGPDAMTVGVPGNVPYIITVGAMSDNYTPADGSDDYLASFSSAGPTVEGFVKPDLVAPGGHMLGLMPLNANIAQAYPQYQQSASYFTMSGTSQATAVTSGIVALMLQTEPGLSPDTVKCRLMAAARPALDEDGALAYSIFQQGAGVVHAADALSSDAAGCANGGLDIDLDSAGVAHYQGKANQDAEGNFYIIDQSGFAWSGGSFWAGGFAWSSGSFWAGGFAWSSGSFWAGGFAWSSNFEWDDTPAWSASAAGINQWVDQE